jgi:predicted nucleotidyltransferase
MFRELLEKLAQALEASGVPYMVIGGQAVLLYGEPRLTRDIDITLGVGPEHANDILAVAKTSGLEALVESVSDFVHQTLILPCQQGGTGIRVDFIFSFSPYEQQALQRARIVEIGQARVRFASLEDLIIHKIFAGRPRDLEDARIILLKNQSTDVDYIRKWLAEFEQALNEPYGERFEALWKDTRR